MESLTGFLNRKKKHRKEQSAIRVNGPVVQIAMPINKNPEPIQRKVLHMPIRKLSITHYTPIEVPYLDKNGNDKVYYEPEFVDLPTAVQKGERKRLLPKHYDQEAMYRIYGK